MLSMLWLKAFHLISIVTWFSGLFYLPRLFVYHSMISDQDQDQTSDERFKIMESKLYYGITMPSMIAAIFFGGCLLVNNPALLNALWFKIKLILVFSLVIYHFYCGYFLSLFKSNQNTYTHVFYRFFNEFPAIILISVIILVEIKPF